MAKITATLYDLLNGELRLIYDEFMNDDLLTFNQNEFQTLSKILKYDDEIKEMVTKRFYHGFEFENKLADVYFKKLFINEFLDRQIKFQTVDVFAMKNVSLCMSYENYITEIVTNIGKFILLTSEHDTDNLQQSEQENIAKTRNLFADLPQNMINLDLNNDTLDFATNNTITNNKTEAITKNTNTTKNTTKQYSFENLLKSRELLTDLLTQFDKKLFLQRW